MFFKVVGVFITCPGFSSKEIPTKTKTCIILCLSFFISSNIPLSENAQLLTIFFSFLVGIFVGTLAKIFFVVFDMAGHIVSTFLNLSNAILFNPTSSEQTPVMSVFFSITGMTLFFTMNFHFIIIKALFDLQDLSYINNLYIKDGCYVFFKEMSESFRIALQISAPIFIVGVVTQILLGVVNRIVPQIQVFFMSIPLQIFIILTALIGSAVMGFELIKTEAESFISRIGAN